MASLGQFSLDLSKFAKKCPERYDLVVKKVLFDMFARIVLRTPVDTGRARGNWQIDPRLLSGETNRLDKTGTMAVAEGSSKINSLTTKAKVVGFIFNNCSYILPLEYGSSDQAPRGMVRITLAEFETFIANASRAIP